MPTASDPSETAWDRLLDLIDHLAGEPDNPLPDDLENQFATLCEEAARDGSVDRELHTSDTARWLAGLLDAHRAIRSAHPDNAADDDLAVLRVIVTRWLHPARVTS
jgi:hypothetical protein